MDKIVMRYVSKARQYLAKYGVYTLSDSAIWDQAILINGQSSSNLQNKFDAFIIDCLSRDETDDIFISRLKAKFDTNYFPTCLYNDVMTLWSFVANYLNDNQILKIDFVLKKDAERSAAIYQNLKDSVTPDDKMVEIMASIPQTLSADEFAAECQRRQPPTISQEDMERLACSLIELDPRSKEYYQFIFKEFPHARFEVSAIAQYLGIDLSEEIAEDLRIRFEPKRVTTEEEALQMLGELQHAMDQYGINNCAQKGELMKALQDFDVKARTYEGILFESREQRANAEADDRAIQAMCGDISCLDKDSCHSLISQINAYGCIAEIKNKHTGLLQKRIDLIDAEHFDRLIEGRNCFIPCQQNSQSYICR